MADAQSKDSGTQHTLTGQPPIPEEPPNKRGHEQVPVDPFIVTKIWFSVGTPGDILRFVAMNTESTTQCSSNTEYHYTGTSISVSNVSSFTLSSGTMTATQSNINNFAGSMSSAFNVGQTASWQRGVYSPAAAQARLYKATDPDDNTKMIGVLIEQDSGNSLVQLTWYKTTNAGPVFASTPSSLSFSLVTDSHANPSTDPNDIGGWTWYYSH